MEIEKASGGIGFAGVLFIVFLVLKLCNVIQWSWLWVTAPLWISAGFSIIGLIIFGIIWLIMSKKIRRR